MNDFARAGAKGAAPVARIAVSEPSTPPVGREEFAAVMARLAQTVCVVTAADESERLGRTVTSVLSLSATPPALLVDIGIHSPMAALITRAGGFSLAMLAPGQQEIGDAFAGKLGPVGRFALGRWESWPSGRPRLLGAATTVDCELVGRFETQTHVLFAGAIVGSDTSNAADPLIWYQRRYQRPGPVGG